MVLMTHQDKQHNLSHLYGMDSASLYGLAEMISESIHLTPKISLKCNTYDRHTHPELARLLPQYILGRGVVKFASLPIHSVDVLRLAHQQDLIGWDNFMEGKISNMFAVVQHGHLCNASRLLTSFDWTHHFISKLLHITHGQWIYRNITKHHEKHGLLPVAERRKLLREIDQVMQLPPEDIPEESRFLLEIDFTKLKNDSTDKQSYWVHAIKAAVTAGRRRVFVARRHRPLASHPSSLRRPPVDFGNTDVRPDSTTQPVASTARPKRPGSYTDPSNKRRKPD
eukprot:scaffold38237_cov55-Cyclotella_meneghiniana.AAC.1